MVAGMTCLFVNTVRECTRATYCVCVWSGSGPAVYASGVVLDWSRCTCLWSDRNGGARVGGAYVRGSASSRIRFLPVQAQPTAVRSSRRAVVAPRGRTRSSHWAIFLLNNIAITNNSTFPKIKLNYSISYCNKTKSNNLI